MHGPERANDAQRFRWAEILSGEVALTRRLSVSHPTDIATVDSLKYSRESPREHWADFISNCFRHDESLWIHPGDLPFEDALTPVISYACYRFRKLTVDFVLFNESAIRCFERQLAAHLCFISSLLLQQEFELFRFSRDARFAFNSTAADPGSSSLLYREFCAEMKSGSLAQLLHNRPVLGRLISQSCLQWLEQSTKICRRFSNDIASLRRELDWPMDFDQSRVAHVRTDLSDRHDGGQSVAELVSVSGARVFYKPRPVDGEWAFREFVEMTLPHPLCDLRTVKTVRRGNYGWCESIAYQQCQTPIDVSLFYRKAGMLLALGHVLAATDLHFENMVAAGSDPVLVDLETLMCGWIAENSSWTVLNTGLLPRLRTSTSGRQYDLGGLTAGSQQRTQIERREWRNLNKDTMHLSEGVQVLPNFYHLPIINNRIADASKFVGQICEGFDVCYSYLESAKNWLVDSSIIKVFDSLSLRVMLRSTETYASLQLRLLHPEYLIDGIDRSIELEWLARPITAPDASEARVRIYEHERQAMERLDIPRFSTSFANDQRLHGSGIEETFLGQRRDATTIRRRISALCTEDRVEQLKIIVQSFGALQHGIEF